LRAQRPLKPSEVKTLPPVESAQPKVALDTPLTHEDATVGSPPYMSPEQWTDPTGVGPASDLYALGIVAYETLTGWRPFAADTIAGYIDLHLRADVPAMGDRFAPKLDEFFRRALSKRPEDRPATALELAAALRVAAGLGSAPAELPHLDDGVRDTW